jgi:hypothetical protein
VRVLFAASPCLLGLKTHFTKGDAPTRRPNVMAVLIEFFMRHSSMRSSICRISCLECQTYTVMDVGVLDQFRLACPAAIRKKRGHFKN